MTVYLIKTFLFHSLINNQIFYHIIYIESIKKHQKAKETKTSSVGVRQWNEEHQAVMDTGRIGMGSEGRRKMAALADDFVHCAEAYAKYFTIYFFLLSFFLYVKVV